jgi:hypothetical protein
MRTNIKEASSTDACEPKPIIQNEAYMKYARYNPIKQIINDTVYQQGMQDFCMP